MFGLPDGVAACLFDMDGVVTQTAVVHAAAWKEMFDEFLRARATSTGTEFVPFDPHADYGAFVDGKPRLDGTSAFRSEVVEEVVRRVSPCPRHEHRDRVRPV